MSISKPHSLKLAKKQFIEDLKNDPDFLDYKKNAESNGYGVLISSATNFVLNNLTPTSQWLITRFFRKPAND